MSRPLKDSALVKRASRAKLLRALHRVTPKLTTKTRCWKHQLVGLYLGTKYDSYAFFLDPGLGKTKLSLDLIRWIKKTDEKAALVLVPGTLHVASWIEEAATHAPDLSVAGIDASSREARIHQFNSFADVYVVTYMGLLALLSVRKKRHKRKAWQSEQQMVVDPGLVKDLQKRVGTLVLDESTLVGGHRSTTYRMLNAIRRGVQRCYILTGTPFGKDPTPLWAQMHLVDRGATLGPTLGLFRGAFFRTVKSRFTEWDQFEFDKDKTDELHRMLRNRSVYYRDDECIDLPEQLGGLGANSFMVRSVSLSPEASRYQSKVVESFREAEGNYKLVKNIFLRMRTIASGWLGVVDPQGDKIQLEFKDNAVLDELESMLQNEIPLDRKVVVYFYYMGTGDLIEKRLTKMKERYVRIDGKTSGRAKALESWRRPNGPRVLLGSPAISYGLNLQHHCNHLIVAESPTDPRERKQLERRLRRPGQSRRVFVWDIVVSGSINSRNLVSLREGRDLFDSVMKGKDKLDVA